MKKILIINGPNLNHLGHREVEIYGTWTLDEIMTQTEVLLKREDVRLIWFQSNKEGEIVQRVQEALNQELSGLIINPAGYSHTSVSILDALQMFSLPIVEVHLSNTYTREEFRMRKLTGMAATMIIEGAGKDSYYLAVLSLLIRGSRVSNN